MRLPRKTVGDAPAACVDHSPKNVVAESSAGVALRLSQHPETSPQYTLLRLL